MKHVTGRDLLTNIHALWYFSQPGNLRYLTKLDNNDNFATHHSNFVDASRKMREEIWSEIDQLRTCEENEVKYDHTERKLLRAKK